MIFTAALVIFGVIMVFSASYYYSISQDGTAYSYLFRQLAWVAVGTVALLFGATFDYRKYRKVAVPGLIFERFFWCCFSHRWDIRPTMRPGGSAPDR